MYSQAYACIFFSTQVVVCYSLPHVFLHEHCVSDFTSVHTQLPPSDDYILVYCVYVAQLSDGPLVASNFSAIKTKAAITIDDG